MWNEQERVSLILVQIEAELLSVLPAWKRRTAGLSWCKDTGWWIGYRTLSMPRKPEKEAKKVSMVSICGGESCECC